MDTRDRSLIEKGKQFNELRTEKWEVEKEMKKKLQDQQLEYEKRLENMEVRAELDVLNSEKFLRTFEAICYH